MIKPIYLYNSTILRKPTKEVSLMTPEIEQVILDLYDTVKSVNGLGLAAPQIGSDYRIFVLNNGRSQACFINPEVIEVSEETVEDIEGCLSLPGLGILVERPVSITVSARDVDLVLREFTFESFLARIFMHEYDHLQGIMMFSRMSHWGKQKQSYVPKYLKRLSKGAFTKEGDKDPLVVSEPEYPYILDNGKIYREPVTPLNASLLVTE